MEAAIVQKSGEMCIKSSLKRSSQGLIVSVMAHPRVEEFMQRLAMEEVVDVVPSGRHWTALDGRVLRAYGPPTVPLDPLRTEDGLSIGIDRLGQPLIEFYEDRNTGRGEEKLNLSFLRLVGISEGDGVSFLLKSVYSLQGMKKLRDQLQSAQTILYNGYLRPIEFTIATYTQELRM